MDSRNAILEVRAGAGGLEASLFAQELLNMYMNYARIQGWKFDIVSTSESDVGGLKEGMAQISGVGVFGKLKFESGCHRGMMLVILIINIKCKEFLKLTQLGEYILLLPLLQYCQK